MKTHWKAVFCIFVIVGISSLWAQDTASQTSVLKIVQSRTTSRTDFPTFLATYHVLNGATSPAEALALNGTISLQNNGPTFSEVLWVLVYWPGTCATHDISQAQILWTDILKNPSQSTSTFHVNLDFARPLSMTGCVGLYFGGGPLLKASVTMSADLNLTYKPVANSNPNTVVDISGEYCFGQDWGCQNHTLIDGEAFAVPIPMITPGHLLELYGNISDSTFNGASDFGPLPTGTSWGAVNDFYLLPGGCGIFSENLNSDGFPNPAPLSTLHSWLPKDALHLTSVPLIDRTPLGEATRAALQSKVESIFSVPVKVNSGDCMLVIYGRAGNGATDNETQVHALIAP